METQSYALLHSLSRARVAVCRTSRPLASRALGNPTDVARLDDPILPLQDLDGLVILDEIQRRPELFPILRVLADRPRLPARFLVLGSASPGLLQQSSESLAGRIHYHGLGGFALDEVGLEATDRLWLRGGFPDSFLARSDAASASVVRQCGDLEGHPKVGASWEGFALQEVITHLRAHPEECFFGPHTPGQSLTCWWCVASGAGASSSNAPWRLA